MVKVLGIDFAPLHVPIERRLQTLMVILFTCSFTIFPVLFILACVALLFTRLYWLTLLYVAWIFYDVVVLETSSRGGRRIESFRRSRAWNYFRDYFPAELVKTADLSPEKNYILGYHPHGIIGCGAIANFGTEAGGFSTKFPGITPHLLTLKANFKIPISRGFTMYCGLCDVSRESIEWITTRQGKGNAAIIVVGGAEEALEARPGEYRLTLKRRKGFVRIALKTGADLVPIYSFGENDLYVQADNPAGSVLRRIQDKCKRITGVSPPLFHGRGIFNYSFGLLPYRKAIHTVVGSPIPVEKCENPEQELVDEYHQKYLNSLSDLFDKHKEKYGVDKDKKLQFV